MPESLAPAFGPDAPAFFRDLRADHSKAFWAAHKPRFEREVAAPMRALLGALGGYGLFKTFRMHRDVRFSTDKAPYKLMHGAAATTEGGSVHYLHLDDAGVLVAAGAYQLARDQLGRFREALLDDVVGPAFVRAVEAVEASGVEVGSGGPEPLKRAPRGVDPAHVRIEWLRWRGAIASQRLDVAEADPAPAAAVWSAASPLVEWLDAHVGPSTESRF